MARIKRKSVVLSAVAAAVALALYAPCHSFANDDTESFNVKTEVKETTAQRHLRLTSSLATDTIMVMQENSSQKYLQNRHFGDSATFPLRLFAKLEKNPWRPAPFMPILERDLECFYGVPSYRVPQDYDVNTTPINVTADTLQGTIDQNLLYKGNVVITQADVTLNADSTEYDQNSTTLTSTGNVLYKAPTYTLSTKEQVTSNLSSNITTVQNAGYILNGSVGSGTAEHLQIDDANKTANIEGFTFTGCPPDDKVWEVTAGDVELIQGESFGEAHNATLRVKGVPVFWTPYINFPISNKRKSGLLYPSMSYSSSKGFDYAQPIYFNIAPNYDYTFTPRVMGFRGAMLQNEFRYMPFAGTRGEITFDFLPNDRRWDLAGDNHQRWMFGIKHFSGFLNNDLTFNIDYKRVKPHDYDYLSDIGSDNAHVTDNHLVQTFRSAYNKEKYDVSLELRKYQSLLPDYASVIKPFSMLPQLKASYYDTYGNLFLRTDGEFTYFNAPNENQYHNFGASRFHLEPSAKYLIYNNRGTELSAGGRLFLTHYEQGDLYDLPSRYRNQLGFTSFDDSVNRALYLIEVRGKTTFERKVFDLRHTQTFEPEIQYRYIPYKNQDHIGLYDTTDRLEDYYSNFSFRHFAGIDRIADTNAITVGVTSRILDPHDREMYRVALSQTYSFVPTRVTLNPSDPINRYPSSPLSVSVDASPIEPLTMHAMASYDNETNEVTAWNAMSEYATRDGFKAQISYRFAQDGNRTLDSRYVDLKQIGLQLVYPITPDFKIIGAMYRDLEQAENIDRKIALRYEDCCYALTFMYEDYNTPDWSDLTREHEKRFGIQIELKGFATINVSGDDNPASTDTYLIDPFNPTNLNR